MLQTIAHRKMATQRKIAEAARDEFTSTEFEAARIDVIAARAGVSRQLVYQYYKSKEGLYAAVLDLEAAAAYDSLSSIDYEQPSVVNVLRDFVAAVFDHQYASGAAVTIATAQHGSCWLTRTAKVHEVTQTFLEKIRAALERGKSAGVIDPAANAEDFYLMTTIIATGTVPAVLVYEKLLMRDYHSKEAIASWRERAVQVMLRSVLRFNQEPPDHAT
jgi:TetR/AcrR family transcriptional regulator